MRVLCACSGGPDSAAMLVALVRLAGELQLALDAASVDHGLRAGAAADLEFARTQAHQLGVPFHALKLQLQAGASLQARAREARYAALTRLAVQLGASRIAVGHTLDDQAETVLMRILRGTGLDGVAGIQPLRTDGVMRPLIDCRRADARRFALDCGLQLADDPSNRDRRFERVRARAEILPRLREENTQVDAHLAQLADEARSAAQVLELALLELSPRPDRAGLELDAASWLLRPSALRRRALGLWAARHSGSEPGRAQLLQLEHALEHGGEVWLAQGWVAAGPGGGRLRMRASDAASKNSENSGV